MLSLFFDCSKEFLARSSLFDFFLFAFLLGTSLASRKLQPGSPGIWLVDTDCFTDD